MTRRERRRAAAQSRQVTDARPMTADEAVAATTPPQPVVRSLSDSYQNLEARLGAGSGNVNDASGYALTNLITRQPRNLEYMYRGSWIVRAAVDAIADDMVRERVDFGSALPPEDTAAMTGAMNALQLWSSIADTIRWGRLYGGGIGVLLIDGQDVNTPLRLDAIKEGQFRGVLPIDRWCLNPNVLNLVDELGPHLGKPEIYTVGPNAPALRMKNIHYSRVIRAEGARLPYFQKLAEQGWGLSIVEPMYDRLLAFDSATTGAAQLVFKAYLRTLKIKGLKDILGGSMKAQEALAKNVEAIRRFQTTEGLTLIDADDTFETHAYTFSGLDDILLQFGQQLSGATGIPLVRLFGQSPAGLNSTGDSDIRNYYDGIKSKQESDLRTPLTLLFDILHRSVIGKPPPEGFDFQFNPLWQLTDDQKATAAKTTSEAIGVAFDMGIISKAVALKELKQSSDVSGVFTNISDDDIKDAEEEPPEPDMGETALAGLQSGDGPAVTPAPNSPEAQPKPQIVPNAVGDADPSIERTEDAPADPTATPGSQARAA